jgi:ribose transport system substrate-binding protein
MTDNRTHRATGVRRWALIGTMAIVAGACSSAATPVPTAAPTAAPTGGPTAAPSAPPSVAASASAAPSAQTAESEQTTGGKNSDTSFCGTKQITLGIHDGYGVNAWSQASYAAVRSEAAKCPNVKQIAIGAGGDIPKANSDVNSMVAQGINALVIIPDAGGPAQLPAIQAATTAGVSVVPWASDPSGTAGTDYLTYVDWNTVDAGKKWATWMVQALGGKGNVVFLGGPAGVAVGVQELEGIKSVFDANPGMVMLTGYTEYAVTNWDPATAQKAMAALLAKYPQIDGVISNYGTDGDAAIRAFTAANRPIVPLATLEEVGLSCGFAKLQATNPKYQLATISSRNWLGRVAARKAIAAAEGIANSEPSLFDLPIITDTLKGAPACDSTLPEAQDSSNFLTKDELDQWGKPTS